MLRTWRKLERRFGALWKSTVRDLDLTGPIKCLVHTVTPWPHLRTSWMSWLFCDLMVERTLLRLLLLYISWQEWNWTNEISITVNQIYQILCNLWKQSDVLSLNSNQTYLHVKFRHIEGHLPHFQAKC